MTEALCRAQRRLELALGHVTAALRLLEQIEQAPVPVRELVYGLRHGCRETRERLAGLTAAAQALQHLPDLPAATADTRTRTQAADHA